MDPNQWNTYNIQYTHPTSGGLPSMHSSLNRLDLSTTGLSHQLQAGRGVPSLQAVNYQALSGLPILDTLSPLTSGLSAQGHQLLFNPQTNRISAEPQVAPPPQALTPAHHYENPSMADAKSAASRVTAESLGRNQLLEAARMWTSSAASFTSPTSLYNQFNATLFPQSVEVSASPSHVSVASVSKSNHNQNIHQHPYLSDPPPAHSSNMSTNSRLLPMVQRSHDHNLQAGASELLYNRSAPLVSESSSQVPRSHYTTHKAVVLGVGNSGLMQFQSDIHRQTPVQQQHHQQHHGGYQSHRGGDIEDLSASNVQSNIYGSCTNISSEPQNFASNLSHSHQQHLTPGDLSYEAVSPAPALQHQRQQQQQQQQQESNMSVQHSALSLHLAQFSDLSNLTPEHAHALADKFQLANRQQQLQHAEPLRSSSSTQRQQGSSTQSLKVPSQQHQGIVTEANRYQAGSGTTGNQNLGQILNAGRQTTASQHQTLAASSGQLLNAPTAPSTIQAMADSTTKPKRSRSRKKKGETAAPPLVTPVAGDIAKHSPILSQLQEQQQLTSQPPPSPSLNLNKKSNPAFPQLQQQLHLSQPSLGGMTPSSPHISTLSMAPTNPAQQLSYARAQTPLVPPSYPGEHQHQAFQQAGLKPANHNVADIAQGTYKQSKKSPAKSKPTAANLGVQQAPPAHAFPQLSTNLNQENGQVRLPGYNNGEQKQGNHPILSSSHIAAPLDGPYSKLLNQNQMIIDGVGYNHLHQPDHLLDDDEGSVQQQQQFQMDFDNQPFMEQLASVPAPVVSGYGGETILTTIAAHDEHSGSGVVADARSAYHLGHENDIHYGLHAQGELKMEDVAFNLFQADNQQEGSLQEELQPEPEPEMTLTFVPQMDEDDELGHFTEPSLSEPVPMLPKEQQNQPRGLSNPAPASASPANNSFQNSFLSYLQGHKQETLSSVSSAAVTKKPQLPKYIPEPRRPKPPTLQASTSRGSSHASAGQGNIKRLGSAVGTLGGTALQKNAGEKQDYSVQRTSDLAVKITLPKNKSKSRFGPFAESTLLKDSMQKNRDRKMKKGKSLMDLEGEEFFEEDLHPVHKKKRPPPREKTPPPARTSIGRKAKDKCMEMTKKNRDNSDSDEDFGIGAVPSLQSKSKSKGYQSDDSIYNSDEDPAWMPFEVDLNQGDVLEKRKKPRRPRARLPSIPKTSKPGGWTNPDGFGKVNRAGGSRVDVGQPSATGPLKIGTYMIERKDKQNCESYPIWRMEENNLMKKFELRTSDGMTKHVATETFFTWMPSMESQFETIKVRELEMRENGGVSAVEVLDEFKPKAPAGAKLDGQSDEDPLVDPFSIYLQVFLSQALEPNFLTVIKETNETFYLDALNAIDGMIERKCKEITKLARWKTTFQEALHRCPLMKEIDRPNLKQPCQASENASPPSIKSVFLSGLQYDRFLLTEKPAAGSNNPQEFMIGKVAAHFVRTYHSLYHFKYWLRQRCDAKVKMTKESTKLENLPDETILDKCLENRNWVLQLLENLKNLLTSGGDSPT
ncbi:hypothetical protein EGW08_010586 [Elysia chlorotica]|uniref:DUF4211 domain-containing protein n=1 Tax=Elysia chlorotica TaxID=188477 RepID=A0A3S1A3C3_ELYCH|nr:hypothetical protein EGW08_010586 [Elysia chlorotica]